MSWLGTARTPSRNVLLRIRMRRFVLCPPSGRKHQGDGRQDAAQGEVGFDEGRALHRIRLGHEGEPRGPAESISSLVESADVFKRSFISSERRTTTPSITPRVDRSTTSGRELTTSKRSTLCTGVLTRSRVPSEPALIEINSDFGLVSVSEDEL